MIGTLRAEDKSDLVIRWLIWGEKDMGREREGKYLREQEEAKKEILMYCRIFG